MTELLPLFWDEIEPPRAVGLMRQAFFRIRCALGSSSLVENTGTIQLLVDLDSDIPRSRAPTVIPARAHGADLASLPSSGSHDVEANGAPVVTSAGSADDDDITRWLDELWRATMQGTPLSAWITPPTGSDLRQVIRDISARSFELGGRLAHVKGKGAAYAPHALELDLIEVLRDLPGTAGIIRKERDGIDRSGSNTATASMLLRAAIIDVIAAAAEDAPLLMILEDVERYSVSALRDLIARLTRHVECPVLLLTVGASGSRPVTPISFVYSPDGSARGSLLVS